MFISEEVMQRMQEQLEGYPDLLPDASFDVMNDLYGLFNTTQLDSHSGELAPQPTNRLLGVGTEDTFHPEEMAPPTPGPSHNNVDNEYSFDNELPNDAEEEGQSASMSLGKLLTERQCPGADQRIQLARSRTSSRVPKATRQAVTERRRENAARFKAALEQIREKMDTEIAEVASRFDMKVEDVSRRLQHDTRWASKK
jgi:hypothetical protein